VDNDDNNDVSDDVNDDDVNDDDVNDDDGNDDVGDDVDDADEDVDDVNDDVDGENCYGIVCLTQEYCRGRNAINNCLIVFFRLACYGCVSTGTKYKGSISVRLP
jgi:hypothetical protein